MRRKFAIGIMVLFLSGCALADMSKLDPNHYPLRVRQGDIIDKWIYDQTYIPLDPVHKKIFKKDYIDFDDLDRFKRIAD